MPARCHKKLSISSLPCKSSEHKLRNSATIASILGSLLSIALISVKVTKRRAHEDTHPNMRVIIDELQPRVKSIPFLCIKIWIQNPESTPKKSQAPEFLSSWSLLPGTRTNSRKANLHYNTKHTVQSKNYLKKSTHQESTELLTFDAVHLGSHRAPKSKLPTLLSAMYIPFPTPKGSKH